MKRPSQMEIDEIVFDMVRVHSTGPGSISILALREGIDRVIRLLEDKEANNETVRSEES